MNISKVALVGATGNLGPAILKALLDAGFDVTILSREGSASTDSLASHPRQMITKVNFDNTDSITSALRGVEGVVSNVSSSALLTQKPIIDAAIAAGVRRFLPSDFGSDLSVESNRSVPLNTPKVEIHRYLVEKSKEYPDFSYTGVHTGPFFDWCLRHGLYGNLKTHEVTLWDGGNTKFSTTTLASVGKAVVGVFRNLEGTKNQELRVADATITQRELIGIVKEIDGIEWTTNTASTGEAYQVALKEIKKPQPNMEVFIYNQLYRIMFSDEQGVSFESRLNNDKVGLPLMTKDQVKEVVRSCLT